MIGTSISQFLHTEAVAFTYKTNKPWKVQAMEIILFKKNPATEYFGFGLDTFNKYLMRIILHPPRSDRYASEGTRNWSFHEPVVPGTTFELYTAVPSRVEFDFSFPKVMYLISYL